MALCVTSRGETRAVAVAALVALLPFAAAQTERTPQRSVTAVRNWASAGTTRIAVEVSGEFSFRTDRIHNPERVYFDILNARPNFASRRIYSEAMAGPLALRIRVAETLPGVTRVVIDLGDGVEVTSSTLSNPYRLIVELRKAREQGPEAAKGASETGLGAGGARATEATPRRQGPMAGDAGAKSRGSGAGEGATAAPAGVTIPRPAPLSNSAAPAGTAPTKAGRDSEKAAEPEAPSPRPQAPSPQPKRPEPPATASARTERTSKASPDLLKTAEPEIPIQKAAVPNADAPKRPAVAPKPSQGTPEAAPATAEAAIPPVKSVGLQRPTPPSDRDIGPTIAPKPAQSASEISAKTAETDIATPRSTPGAKRASSPQLVAAAEPAPAKRTSSGQSSLVRALGLKISRVVIDAGHGGHDQGTEGPHGLLEKDLVLDVAKRLGKLIEDRMGAEVIYTRSDDTYIALRERTALANEKKADLFLSIHANYSPSAPRVAGVETYYLNITGAKDAMDVAARENATSDESVFELADLIQKIAKQDKADESREFANRIQTALYAFSVKNVPAAKDRGVKSAPFTVLIGANMPSVLVEIGFLSNTREESLLKKSDYRQKLADALYRGVSRYTDSLSHFPTATAKSKD